MNAFCGLFEDDTRPRGVKIPPKLLLRDLSYLTKFLKADPKIK